MHSQKRCIWTIFLMTLLIMSLIAVTIVIADNNGIIAMSNFDEAIIADGSLTGADGFTAIQGSKLGVETEDPINGKKSLVLNATESWNEYLITDNDSLLVGYSKYTVAYRFKYVPGSFPQMVLMLKNKSGDMMSTITHLVDCSVSEQKAEATGYSKPELSFSVESNIYQVTVEFEVADEEVEHTLSICGAYTGTYIIDDLMIVGGDNQIKWEPIDTEKNPYEEGLLSQNSFEELSISDTVTGLDDFIAIESTKIGSESKRPINGTKSIAFITEGGWNELIKTDMDKVKLNGEEMYTVAFRLYSPSSTFPQLSVAFKNADNTTMSIITLHRTGELVESISNSEDYSVPEYTYNDKGEYIEIAISFETENTQAEHQVMFAVSHGGVFVLDDIKFYTGNPPRIRWDEIKKPQTPIFIARFEHEGHTSEQLAINDAGVEVDVIDDDSEKINGLSSLKVTPSDDNLIDAFKIEGVLESDNLYTVAFRLKADQNTSTIFTIIDDNQELKKVIIKDGDISGSMVGFTTEDVHIIENDDFYDIYLTFEILDQENCYIELLIEDGGWFIIDDLFIYYGARSGFSLPEISKLPSDKSFKQLLANEDYESSVIQFTDSGIDAKWQKINDYNSIINGRYSMKYTIDGNRSILLSTAGSKIVITPSTYYTVMMRISYTEKDTAFLMGLISLDSFDGYLQLINGEDSSYSSAEYFSAVQKDGYIEVIATLYSYDLTDAVFAIGGYTAIDGEYGTMIIDDFKLFEGTHHAIDSSDWSKVEKVSSQLDVGVLDASMKSNFEDGNLLSGFIKTTGNAGTTVILAKNGLQLNGSSSVLCSVLVDDYRTYMFSNFTNYYFVDKTWYTIQYRLRIEEPLQEGKVFYIIAKALNGTNDDNIALIMTNDKNKNPILDSITEGAFYSITNKDGYSVVTMSFYTGQRDDYYLEFGGNGKHTILMDDFRVFVGGLAEDYDSEPELKNRKLSSKQYQVKSSYTVGEQIKIALVNLFNNEESIPLKYSANLDGVEFTTSHFIFTPEEEKQYTITITATADDGGEEEASITLTFNAEKGATPTDPPKAKGCKTNILTTNPLTVSLLLLCSLIFIAIRKKFKKSDNYK